jgi:hypothetical protein
MSKLIFKRNRKTGTFTATGPKHSALTIFKDAEGRWRWRQAPRYGKPVVSDQMFPERRRPPRRLVDHLGRGRVHRPIKDCYCQFR